MNPSKASRPIRPYSLDQRRSVQPLMPGSSDGSRTGCSRPITTWAAAVLNAGYGVFSSVSSSAPCKPLQSLEEQFKATGCTKITVKSLRRGRNGADTAQPSIFHGSARTDTVFEGLLRDNAPLTIAFVDVYGHRYMVGSIRRTLRTDLDSICHNLPMSVSVRLIEHNAEHM